MLSEKYNDIPYYDNFMHLKGYKPYEILNSIHKTLIEEYEENNGEDDTVNVVITTKEK